jgi:2-succinyl-5-enolpyruvyl-6-hydroxy-3-cyclohexene-1-carboxylate synthase
MYRFKYHVASTEATLEMALQAFFSDNEQPQLLEVFTPTMKNDGLLKKYFGALI